MGRETRSRPRVSSSKVYTSSPALYQATFPARRRITKTYDRAPPSSLSLRQQTLTQIDYLVPIDPGELEPEYMEDDYRPQKRRKTLGDTPSSSFHTQTLTQLYSDKGSNAGEILLIRDSEDEDEGPDPVGNDDFAWETAAPKGEMEMESRAVSMVPQTPRHKKIVAGDLRSRPTPISPMLDRYEIEPDRSPLREKPTNVSTIPPSAARSQKRRRTEVVLDSYDTIPSSSAAIAQATSVEVLRSPIATNSAGLDPAGSVSARKTPTVPGSTLCSTRTARSPAVEIPDSDDELISLGPTPRKLVTTQQMPERKDARRKARSEVVESSDYEDEIRSPTPMTRKVVTLERERAVVETPSTPTPAMRKNEIAQLASSGRPLEGMPGSSVQEIMPVLREDATIQPASDGRPTPKQPIHDNITHPSVHELSQRDNVVAENAQMKSQYFTQDLESQRIPLEVIRAMGPQTDRSDIIISIHPEPVEQIVNGTKTHEFRNYKLPAQVSRIWIYVTRPVCELQYMAVISQAQQPGELENESGVGNAEFNRGESAHKFAHELCQVYQLNNPVPLAVMRDNGWIENAPNKYVYVPPAVVGQLLANLRCALFDDGPAEARAEASFSVSQEVEAQIRSDIAHSTQLVFPEARHESVVPFSQGQDQDPTAPQVAAGTDSQPFARPSLPMIRNASNWTMTPPRAMTLSNSVVHPSQTTTVSELSTPAVSPEKSMPRPMTASSSLPSFPDMSGVDIDVDLDVDEDSSEGRTRRFELSSQAVLPDSLVDDGGRRPPEVNWDGEDEDLD